MWLDHSFFGISIPSSEWRAAHTKYAQRFYKLAVHMRGGFIKIGQILSTRVDLLPKEWTSSLSRLQDKVDPTPWEGISQHIEEQLGAPANDVFAKIDAQAVAAASFGQVHRATTHSGQQVALKIKYPNIDYLLNIDLRTLRFAVPFFNIFIPKVNLKTIYAEITRALTTELDYDQEATYTEMIGANLEGCPDVFIPKVLREYTTKSVICTTYFDGFKITDHEKIDRLCFDMEEIIRTVMYAYTRMIFVDGVFQSDPHPGNLMLRTKGDGQHELCILDFGQVKVLPDDFQSVLLSSAIAFMGRDVDGFLKSLFDLGMLSQPDAEKARPVVARFFSEYFDLSPQELRKVDLSRIERDVKKLASEIEGIHIPTDIVLYGRTFGMLAGVITQLDPNVNGFVLARPLIMQALTNPQSFKN